MAGEITEVGKEAKLAGFNIGDKVIGLNKESCGGFAEECVVLAKVLTLIKTSSSIKTL